MFGGSSERINLAQEEARGKGVVEKTICFSYNQSVQERLDVVIAANERGEISRSRSQTLIRQGHVRVSGIVIKKTSQMIKPGDYIEVSIPATEQSTLIPENIPLSIVFENSNILVVDKPAGMVVHPSPGHNTGTLVHAVLAHVSDLAGIGGIERPGIVHRLDKDTSGLLVIAKNEASYRFLQNQFKSRSIEKRYIALVDGKPPSPTGRIDAPIGRNTSHRKLMAVVPDQKGREAISEYRTLESFQQHTLLEVHPLSGRTHQIRVHLAFIGCPVAADLVYGRRKPTITLSRHFLHAYKLRLIPPGEVCEITFQADLPSDLNQVLKELRNHDEHNERC